MKERLKVHLLLTIGWFFVLLGFIGIFLPVMPTTPFLLVAAACFSRGSPRLHHWLLTRKHFGPALRDWEENKVIRKKAKILASICICGGISFPIIFVDVIWQIKATIAAIGVGVLIYIWLQKSTPTSSVRS